ncbi:CHAD domain-containing protein (plasmid) [Photobacterium sp. GJ3]|uniref:CHAD domain-containing protein n=1 Tax=Photobacterium sp. GJ3 TaxID=2829502 RepID=UPI001B8BF45A|nr:CHAD domain-containing protein [Photobacterium sp. GJ3]QUJ69977.1 CHAD domain-containing protein [Photobacterium sp. GJ3]
MSMNKRDKLRLPTRKRAPIKLKKDSEIYLPTYHFLKTEFQHARRHEKGLIRDDDTEFLHQYRVSLRRCRALIGMLGPIFYPEQKVMLQNDLKTCMQKTNALRDLDVYLDLMEIYFDAVEPQHHEGLSLFFNDLKDRRTAQFVAVTEWLDTPDYTQQCAQIAGLIDELEHKTTEAGKQPCLPAAKKSIWKRFKKTLTLCQSVGYANPDEHLHQLRISCKKLRYLLEYFAPMFPKKVIKDQIKQLKLLQDVLGVFNDSSVQITFLNQYLEALKPESKRHQAISHLLTATEKKHADHKISLIDHVNQYAMAAPQKSFEKLYRD